MNEGAEGGVGTDRWAEALTWHATLHGAAENDLTTAVGREWQDWHADPENQRVFDELTLLLADRDLYGRRGLPTRAELEADRYDLSVPIAEWRKTLAPRLGRKQRASGVYGWRWLSGGLAGAAVAAIAVLLIRAPLQFWSSAAANGSGIYQTGTGELETVKLSDGSSLVLGGRTQISVAFSAERRSVSLIKGQVWFKVAHRRHWPFIVNAGHGTIQDVGTAFVVTRDSDRVLVAVTEGAVEVSAAPLSRTPGADRQAAPIPALAPIRVIQGEELAFTDRGLGPPRREDTHVATAWTRGRLIFDGEPLRYVVATLNRYSPRRITVSPGAGALRLSGIVADDQINQWLQALEAVLPVTVEERGSSICIHRRSSSSHRVSSDESCTKPD